LKAEFDQLEEAYSAVEALPDEVDQRLGELETALEALGDRPLSYDPEDVARAGAFFSIARDGSPCVERGYIRPEDEPPIEPEPEVEIGVDGPASAGARHR
jgi:ParB family chromosome partitioning protein